MPSPMDTSALAHAPKAPPRKRATTSKAPIINDGKTIHERREEGLIGLGQLGVAVCLLGKQYADAGAINKHWAPIASETTKLAATNESVAKIVDMVTELGPYGALILATLPLVMQLMANHGMVKPDNASGGSIVPPQILEAEMRANIARMQAQALRDQQLAMEELAEAQREYEEEMARHTIDGQATEGQ